MSALEALGCRIAGVSPDSVESHRKFSAKLNLPYTLLSDPEHEFIEACGFWKLKKLYGKVYKGVERSTLIVGPEGIVECYFANVKVAGHAEDVLQTAKGILEREDSFSS